MEINKNTTYITIAVLAIIGAVGVWYLMGMAKVDYKASEAEYANSDTSNEGIDPRVLESAPLPEEIDLVRQAQESIIEIERQQEIDRERQELLAEQQALEQAQAEQAANLDPNAPTLTEQERQAQQDRGNQIQAELLELQNQEEYPPLGNPGI